MTVPDQPWQEESHGELTRDAAFVIQAHRFLDAVEGLAPPLCTLQEGLQTLRSTLAVLASVEQGTWQSVCVSSTSSIDN